MSRYEDFAALAAELADAGVAGVNIEDGRPDGSLADPDAQCELIRAVKAAAPALFVNARTDTYWLSGHRERTGERLAAYQKAGADGLFVPGLQDERTIGALTRELALPLNLLYAAGGLTVARLAELGVARISTGSLLFRAAIHAAVKLARAVARGGAEAADIGTVPSYERAQAWAGVFSSS